MRPKITTPQETPEQKQQRERAERENLRSVQDDAEERTNLYARLMIPRNSIAVPMANPRRQKRVPIMGTRIPSPGPKWRDFG